MSGYICIESRGQMFIAVLCPFQISAVVCKKTISKRGVDPLQCAIVLPSSHRQMLEICAGMFLV